MVLLYIICFFVVIIYLLGLVVSILILNKDYKTGIAIPLVPKGLRKLMYLYIPVYIPYLLLSYCRILSKRSEYRNYRESVLVNLFANDLSRMKEFEAFIIIKCGTFHICYYSVLTDLGKRTGQAITKSEMFDMVSKLVLLNNVNDKEEFIDRLAYWLLSCFFYMKYDETETQRLIRLQKAGYDVRPSKLDRDEDKHQFRCLYEGKVEQCHSKCKSCIIEIKKEADKYKQSKEFEEAVNKYNYVVNQEPLYAEAWKDLADVYVCLGSPKMALESYIKAIDIDPRYGEALWGAAMSLINLGREGEARGILEDLVKYYDYKEATNLIEELKRKKVFPLAVCRNLERRCLSQIAFVAKYYGLVCDISEDDLSVISDLKYSELFKLFFDNWFRNNEYKISALILDSARFMMLAGMTSSKLLFTEKQKVTEEGLVRLLLHSNGVCGIEDYCCDYLGIPYEHDGENELMPCIKQMGQEAIRLYSDVIGQLKNIEQIKENVRELSGTFFCFGFHYIQYNLEHYLPVLVHPKILTKKDVLAVKLNTIANDPSLKTVNNQEYIRISRRMQRVIRYCDCCHNLFDDFKSIIENFVTEIRELGYDCKLEHLCPDCCTKKGLKFKYLFYIKLDASDHYRQSDVYPHDLSLLSQFLKIDVMDPCSIDYYFIDKTSIQVLANLLKITIG